MAAGKFITFEGGEGAGKSTQAALLRDELAASGIKAILTREPGGSPRAEAIRSVLLSGKAKDFGPMGETLLFYVARDSHLELTIRPALARGEWVICDRFHDSTRAYQGAAGGVSMAAINALERIVVGPTMPDLTLILDLPPEEGLKRAAARAKGEGQGADRFEAMSLIFHQNLRQEFLEIAEAEPARCEVIDAARTVQQVADDIWSAVSQRLDL
ncbi:MULTISPECIES: dTMP kinase [Rhodomicrobium]|uniref:dTMP kinase n=1 Tax=Rhodomicrobium TaxID=1068 RepID=UPI001FD9C110|nr:MULTISPECIES: dTMP kinase [Rhodomicrobium]